MNPTRRFRKFATILLIVGAWYSQMSHHLISDAYEWINEIPSVPIVKCLSRWYALLRVPIWIVITQSIYLKRKVSSCEESKQEYSRSVQSKQRIKKNRDGRTEIPGKTQRLKRKNPRRKQKKTTLLSRWGRKQKKHIGKSSISFPTWKQYSETCIGTINVKGHETSDTASMELNL